MMYHLQSFLYSLCPSNTTIGATNSNVFFVGFLCHLLGRIHCWVYEIRPVCAAVFLQIFVTPGSCFMIVWFSSMFGSFRPRLGRLVCVFILHEQNHIIYKHESENISPPTNRTLSKGLKFFEAFRRAYIAPVLQIAVHMPCNGRINL